MAISELVAIVPPPLEPKATSDNGAWIRAQETLGISLPDEYLEFATHYGSGSFYGGLEIINPLSERFDA